MSNTPLASLRVSQQTSAQDLQTFLESVDDDSAKLRGKKHKDGSVTLYAVDRDSSLHSQMFGTAKKRRDAARGAMNIVLQKTENQNPELIGALGKLVGLDRGHSMKAGVLRPLVGALLQAGQNRAELVKPPHTALDKAPFKGLEQFALDRQKMNDIVSAAKTTQPGAPLSTIARDQMVADLVTHILPIVHSQVNPSANIRVAASDMRAFLMDQLGATDGAGLSPEASAEMTAIIDQTATEIGDRLMGSQLIDSNTVTLNGDTYTAVRQLGAGGFGVASVFRCEDTGKEIVLKFPNGADAEGTDIDKEDLRRARNDFQYELHSHLAVQDALASGNGDASNVVGFEGAVRLPNGLIGIASEYCPKGDMNAAVKSVIDQRDGGQLTQDQALDMYLTMIQDSLSGLQQVANAGFSHRDVKLQNIFMAQDGTAMIGDFGETIEGAETVSLAQARKVDNPIYQAPGSLAATEGLMALQQELTKNIAAAKSATLDSFLGKDDNGLFFGRVGLDDLDKLGTSKAELREIRDVVWPYIPHQGSDAANDIGTGDIIDKIQNALTDKTFTIEGEKADVWSLGISILVSLKNVDQGTVLENRFLSKVQDDLIAYSQQQAAPGETLPNALDIGGLLKDSYVSPHDNGSVTGFPEMDAFLNRILTRSPDDRPDFATLLTDPIFSRAGVGSAQTRSRLAAL